MKDYKKLLKFKSKILVRMLVIINTVRDEQTRDNLLAIQRSFLGMTKKDIEVAKENIVLVNTITRQTKINFVPLSMN